jgi:hypothetical protein
MVRWKAKYIYFQINFRIYKYSYIVRYLKKTDAQREKNSLTVSITKTRSTNWTLVHIYYILDEKRELYSPVCQRKQGIQDIQENALKESF